MASDRQKRPRLEEESDVLDEDSDNDTNLDLFSQRTFAPGRVADTEPNRELNVLSSTTGDEADTTQVEEIRTISTSTSQSRDVIYSRTDAPEGNLHDGDDATVSAHLDQLVVGPCSEESLEQICNRFENTGKNIHMTLTQNIINSPSAVSVGGTVTVQPEPRDENPPQNEADRKLKTLRRQTETDIEEMLQNMEETEVTKRLCRLIDEGVKWLLTTGCPGDGKTVAAYFVLKYLSDLGKEIFIVRRPENYWEFRRKKNAVFLIEDLLGKEVFRKDTLTTWSNVLDDIKQLTERDSSNIILLTQRLNVWKSASPDIAEYQHYIKEFNVSQIKRTKEEKLLIWRCHANATEVEMDRKLVEDICQRTDLLPFGFPTLCKKFFQLKKKYSCDMSEFFLKPVEFIADTIQPLTSEKQNKTIFMELLKRDGKMSLDGIEEELRGDVRDLERTYLSITRTNETEEVQFLHDSVYDGAAFIIAKTNPQFVVDYCRIQFLRDRIKFIDAKDSGTSHVSHVSIRLLPSVKESYLNRSVDEILNKRNIEPVLSHSLYMSSDYSRCLLQELMFSEGLETILGKIDQKSWKSFLFLATSGGTGHILMNICQQHSLSSAEQKEAIFGICQYNAADALQYFRDTFPDFDLNTVNSEQQTPFMTALKYGSTECINLLSSHSHVIVASQTDSDGRSALHLLSESGGNADQVESLILAGGNVNLLCKHSMSPLHYAARKGHCDIATELIRCGADINMSNSSYTPLVEACCQGHTGMIKLLVENKAIIGERCCIAACFAGHVDAVKTLLQGGAVVDKVELLNSACRNGYTRMVRALVVECQTDVNGMAVDRIHSSECPYRPSDHSMVTTPPLFTAFFHGCIEMVQLLIELGADVNKKASDGCTVFHMSNEFLNENNDEKSIVHLIRGGLDVSLAGRDGNTILHSACFKIRQTVVKTILEKGCDVNKPNIYGCTGIHRTCLATFGHARKEEDYNKYPYDALLNIVQMLVESGADINRPDSKGNTPLHLACEHKLGHIVRALMDEGADLSPKNSAGKTALRCLCSGNIESEVIVHVAEEMIKRGANEDDLDGWFKSEYMGRKALLKLKAIKMEGN